MTRQPDDDERLLVPRRSGRTEERVYVKDLDRFISHKPRSAYKYAKRRGWLKWAKWGSYGDGGAWWVTPYAAKRIIAHFRAIQGDLYMNGKDFHERKDKVNAINARNKARRAARSVQGS